MIPSMGKGCPYCRDQDRELSQAWGQRWAAGGELRLGGGEGTGSPIPSPLPNPSYRKGLLDVFNPTGTMLLSSLKPALAPYCQQGLGCELHFAISGFSAPPQWLFLACAQKYMPSSQATGLLISAHTHLRACAH